MGEARKMGEARSTGQWGPLVALAIAQFLMVLDQSVMNVSISQLVVDFDTSVTTIQAVITLYSLIMAMFMLAGGKIGDIIGRRKAFVIGLVIYGTGSAVTAVAPTVAILTLGWSVLEGLGAALVLPALVALVAGNYRGSLRGVAYAVIGGMAGAGIAVGPILGGWATTELTWRVVFVGEVVLVLVILAMSRKIVDAPRTGPPVQLDGVGAALSAVGLGTIVLAVLMASTWGWVQPKQSPIEPFGFAVTPFVLAAGAAVLWLFVRWERRREAAGKDPLVHLDLLKVPTLSSGLSGLFAQNLVLMGVFFGLPLYLQLVIGLDALETGVRMLPVSLAMLVTSAIGSKLSRTQGPRRIVRTGLSVTVLAILGLLATIQPSLADVAFGVSMALLGVGMGLIVSQLGNVVQSSVDASGRGEAGGLQFTGQQLGSSLGIALVGAIVLGGLSTSFLANIGENSQLDAEVVAQVEERVTAAGLDFVTVAAAEEAATAAGLDQASVDLLVEDYQAAQLKSLRTGLLVGAALALLALLSTANLPRRTLEEPAEPAAEPTSTT